MNFLANYRYNGHCVSRCKPKIGLQAREALVNAYKHLRQGEGSGR